MRQRPRGSSRTDTLLPYATLFRTRDRGAAAPVIGSRLDRSGSHRGLLENLLTSHRTGFAAAKSSPVFTRPREESVRLMRRWGQGPKLGKWTHHPDRKSIRLNSSH